MDDKNRNPELWKHQLKEEDKETANCQKTPERNGSLLETLKENNCGS